MSLEFSPRKIGAEYPDVVKSLERLSEWNAASDDCCPHGQCGSREVGFQLKVIYYRRVYWCDQCKVAMVARWH